MRTASHPHSPHLSLSCPHPGPSYILLSLPFPSTPPIYYHASLAANPPDEVSQASLTTRPSPPGCFRQWRKLFTSGNYSYSRVLLEPLYPRTSPSHSHVNTLRCSALSTMDAGLPSSSTLSPGPGPSTSRKERGAIAAQVSSIFIVSDLPSPVLPPPCSVSVARPPPADYSGLPLSAPRGHVRIPCALRFWTFFEEKKKDVNTVGTWADEDQGLRDVSQ